MPLDPRPATPHRAKTPLRSGATMLATIAIVGLAACATTPPIAKLWEGFADHPPGYLTQATAMDATRFLPPLASGRLASMFRWDAEHPLQALTAPVLILAGVRDLVTLPGASRILGKAAPGSHLESVENANHVGFLERANVYEALILAFCDEVLLRGADPQGASDALARHDRL
jgi:pimeloyl-ACP methyl ester carboxylesterase